MKNGHLRPELGECDENYYNVDDEWDVCEYG